ncbi:nitrite reductase/ring-hydroxylating ferredoxin subunit [Melghirimyces profundicolus]|uniref:Nitrite reductase/ring-hydroxylating ferredoxin subunit n=1 Tax=Melghirimyces profundicolus TaxID=1242148 RepID=A0A2T6BSN7_9BACL|nr:Rieske 2Fe-2S domain-containing protein [Melghirimyces profundicolus]PTX59105.1 nitrite reductase/ring-hydroxylating ferredoxin subunit [Melghirimyces profundicolus]
MESWVHAGSWEEIRRTPKTVKGGESGIAVFYHDGEVFAVDNRCPHMGFPLHTGSLCDGILTCHWHHARFDVKTGGTLDPWADDVSTYRTEVKDGEVWVEPFSRQKRNVEQYRRRLREGLEQNIGLVIAKAVVGLVEAGEPIEAIARIGVEFGTRHRRGGWRSGLTILTAMVNIAPKLDRRGRILALYQGLVHVARESAGMGTRFLLEPLPGEVDPDRLARWYRRSVEVRDVRGAERVLLTAIRAGVPEERLADMMTAAVTDHFYMDTGHALDFQNKAFEILKHIGPEHREEVLTSLLPQLSEAERSEELHRWQSPVDLVTPLRDAFARLEELEFGDAVGSVDERALVERIRGDDPLKTVSKMTEALEKGLSPVRLAQLVVLAAAERIERFHVQNDFGDWITVLHTFTHAHAVHETLRRSLTKEGVRAVFHGAMSVYLDRFLNIPAAKPPNPDGSPGSDPGDPADLLQLMEKQQQVVEAAVWTSAYLDRGGEKGRLFNTLGHALLREDAEFHSFQMVEAGMAEHDRWEEEDSSLAQEATRTMILAMTRYLAAHAPTARELPHTARIAWRLHRGEKLFEEPGE